jgi:5-hydroxyisourate hydrolase
MSPITSHVLDTSLGQPARDLDIRLDVLESDGAWRTLARRGTDSSGRVTNLLSPGELEARTYRLTFETGAYFTRNAQPVFYPRIDVVFQIAAPAEHYHIPVLISPFGYSTYRGT